MAKAGNQELQKTAILGTGHIIQEVLIIIKKKKEKTCIPIDVSIPADRNLEQRNQKRNYKKVYTQRYDESGIRKG